MSAFDVPLQQGLSGGNGGYDDDGHALNPSGPGYSWNTYKSGDETQGFDQDAHIYENQRYGAPGSGGTFDLGTASEHMGRWIGPDGRTNNGFDFGASLGQITTDDGKHVQGPSVSLGAEDNGDTFSMGGGVTIAQGDKQVGDQKDGVDFGFSGGDSMGLQVHHGDAWGLGVSFGPITFDAKSKVATDFVKNEASEISEDAGEAKDWAVDKASAIGSEVSDDAHAIGSGISNGASNAKNAVENSASALWDALY